MTADKPVEHLDWRLLLTPEADASAETIAALDDYFSPFAKPMGVVNEAGIFIFDKDHPCLRCGKYHCGFTWGLVHGEGYCRSCKWPARAYHYIKDSKGETISFNSEHAKRISGVLTVVLQYHPDVVRVHRGKGRA